MTDTSDKCNKSHSFTKAQQQGADSSNNINIKNYRRHLWFAKTVALTLQVHFTVHRRELYVKQLGRVSNILNAQHLLFNHYWNNQNPLLMLTLGFNDYAWSGKCLGPTLALVKGFSCFWNICLVFCVLYLMTQPLDNYSKRRHNNMQEPVGMQHFYRYLTAKHLICFKPFLADRYS